MLRKLFVLWAITVAVAVTKVAAFPSIPVLLGIRSNQALLLELNI